MRPKKRSVGRPAGTGQDVVLAIHAATLARLENGGYEALRIEDVARAAGVNKTSIYRRYPTKAELVVAAILGAREEDDAPTPTGHLRRDLIAHLEAKAERLRTPRGRAIAVALTALEGPAVAAIAEELRRRRFVSPTDILDAAIARGELPKRTDTSLVKELLLAPLYYRAIVLRAPLDRPSVEKMVDHVLRSLGVTKNRKAT